LPCQLSPPEFISFNIASSDFTWASYHYFASSFQGMHHSYGLHLYINGAIKAVVLTSLFIHLVKELQVAKETMQNNNEK
jgi:hypothetical protein